MANAKPTRPTPNEIPEIPPELKDPLPNEPAEYELELSAHGKKTETAANTANTNPSLFDGFIIVGLNG